MRLKNEEININYDNPFLEDALNRKESIEILTNILSSLSETFVFCINSPWGTGKTTFVKMWKEHLKSQNFNVVYYNAWENDFVDNALASLISEIEQSIKELDYYETHKAKIDEYLNKTKKIGFQLIKKSVPVAIKLITYGAVDLNQTMKESISGLAEDFAKDQIENFKSAKNCITNFREQLRITVEAINETEEKKRPLIIFIDELDRCRPNFAIEILEKLKHFFNVPNIIFILALDKRQLGHSIKSIYSENMDVDGYLRRFFDLEYALPEPSKGNFNEYLYQKYEVDSYFRNKTTQALQNESTELKDVLKELFYIFELSLRKQEQIFTEICIALRMTPANEYAFPVYLILFIILKNINNDLYYRFFNIAQTPEEIFQYIENFPRGFHFMQERESWKFKAKLIWFSFNNTYSNKYIEEYSRVANSQTSLPNDRNIAQATLNFWDQYDGWNPEGIRSGVKKRIELLSHFTN